MTTARLTRFTLDSGQVCSGIVQAGADARSCYVLAHGAGAGMMHPFMEMIATGLERRRIATFRFQFPYMERGTKRPDPPAVAQATVRAAVEEVRRQMPGLPLVAGGKSFGGRMSSQAQAQAALPGVQGLAFLGFPLHAAGRPGVDRAAHLSAVTLPLLFVQGTRDKLAEEALIRSVVQGLGERASLRLIAQADHSFRVPARSGRRQDDVDRELVATLADWIDAMTASSSS